MAFVHIDGHQAETPRFTNNLLSSSSSSSSSSTTTSVARSDAAKKRLRVMEIFCKKINTCDPTGKLYFKNAMDYGSYIEKAEDIIHKLITNQTLLEVQRAELALEEERKLALGTDKDLINRMKEQKRTEQETTKRKALEEPTWGVALDQEQRSLRDKDGNQIYAYDVKRAKIYREMDETVHRDAMNRKKPLTTIEKERMMGHDRKLAQRRAKSELNDSMDCFYEMGDGNSKGSSSSSSNKVDGAALFLS